MLVMWYKGHVSFAPDLLHACYQTNGVVILVISDPFEPPQPPSLEAVYDELQDGLFNSGSDFAGQRSRASQKQNPGIQKSYGTCLKSIALTRGCPY